MEDRELTAWLLLDRSRSMAFGAVERTRNGCCASSLRLGQLVVRSGNRVVRSCTTAGTYGRSRPDRADIRYSPWCGSSCARCSGGSVTDLNELLGTAARVLHRRSLVVLISDFISEPGWSARFCALPNGTRSSPFAL